MKRIGIIGGTFNPIHLAHLYIAYEAKHQLNLDKVIFMPAGSPPHKDTNGILMAPLRYDMVKLAIASYKDFQISDYEIKKQGYSYTFETLQYLSSPDNRLFFITGADCLMDIEKWKEPEKIFLNCKFIVFNRSGYNKKLLLEQKNKIEKKYDTKISFLDTIDLEISSSMIRQRIKEDKRVDFFLPKEVLDFIKRNQLYKG
ncbi:nicotinate-nucleotide adenylyltransferase [Clostridium septicum]|uniref:Probable nicotinate-nucleotide adenylyltransferase n=1 Tax=Clostridium septicum TaxID=1504 RepID=A0A9N7JLJ0_CLOSE|nr:nicotinate-nucleotide adenylyltransferase [Clostridium septicum]AYE34829.1 nicotinate-nucleotide adenylyltransferase [Clostridium septicum]MDU1313355.1 nicotinate-nucleotide adenylyltransferase [Clostridium septicum]QAS60224.1 nicotinate-nucleotide adenylyltransferase [Clostridium septicum]UEC20522.1 nicotinate-nucleotide adenylyltransferase [Clostridium septicum]USS01423.1 nicotinate-nucleotide adenylyltransferase [Clostridium septicum]